MLHSFICVGFLPEDSVLKFVLPVLLRLTLERLQLYPITTSAQQQPTTATGMPKYVYPKVSGVQIMYASAHRPTTSNKSQDKKGIKHTPFLANVDDRATNRPVKSGTKVVLAILI
jgi:hypothetical protein